MRRSVVMALVLGGCQFAGQGENTNPNNDPPDAAPMIDGETAFDVSPACTAGDIDEDGRCDDTDDWRCGLAPTQPGQSTTVEGNLFDDRETYLLAYGTQVTSNGRTGTPNITIVNSATLTFLYNLQVHCPSSGGPRPGGGGNEGNQTCETQIVGYLVREDGGPSIELGCLVSRQLEDGEEYNAQSVTFSVPAPQSPGIYELRLRVEYKQACDPSSTPPSDGTIAKVCVAASSS